MGLWTSNVNMSGCREAVFENLLYTIPFFQTGSVGQSVANVTQDLEVLDSIPARPHSFISSSADTRAVVSYWQKYVHEVLVNIA